MSKRISSRVDIAFGSYVLRDIIETDRFAREREAIEPDARRMDEILDGVVWALSRHPEMGQRTQNQSVLAIPTEPWPGAPPLVIYYQFDDDSVTWLSIRPASLGATDDEA